MAVLDGIDFGDDDHHGAPRHGRASWAGSGSSAGSVRSLPVLRTVSVLYIELIRGAPLYVLLLVSFVALGFLVPEGMRRPDNVARAIVVFTLFTAAYIAEIVRGGLQSLPKGQTEAAQALGLSPTKTTALDRAAPGAAQRHPGDRRPVHQPVQGHHARRRGDGAPRDPAGPRGALAQDAFQGQRLIPETLAFVMLCSGSGASR